METDKTNDTKDFTTEYCSSSTRMYKGKDNEIICVKVYKGDWGDWDEKPVVKNDENSQNSNED